MHLHADRLCACALTYSVLCQDALQYLFVTGAVQCPVQQRTSEQHYGDMRGRRVPSRVPARSSPVPRTCCSNIHSFAESPASTERTGQLTSKGRPAAAQHSTSGRSSGSCLYTLSRTRSSSQPAQPCRDTRHPVAPRTKTRRQDVSAGCRTIAPWAPTIRGGWPSSRLMCPLP